MKKKMIFIPFFFIGIVALLIWGLMHLWNWLVPDVFGWSTITYWQAAGLLVLSKILFGGFGGGGKHKCHCKQGNDNGWKHKFKNKWMAMSAEDKRRWEEKFAGTTAGRGCSDVRSELDSTKMDDKE